MTRVWQDEWSLSASGAMELRLFVEEAPCAGFVSGIEARNPSTDNSGTLISKSLIEAPMLDRIRKLLK